MFLHRSAADSCANLVGFSFAKQFDDKTPCFKIAHIFSNVNCEFGQIRQADLLKSKQAVAIVVQRTQSFPPCLLASYCLAYHPLSNKTTLTNLLSQDLPSKMCNKDASD